MTVKPFRSDATSRADSRQLYYNQTAMRGVIALVAWAALGCSFDEEGVNSAPEGQLPDAPQDAMSPIDGARLPSSCAALLSAMPGAASGTHDIDPAGDGLVTTTYCDMQTMGGGWTLLQRTVWDFAQNAPLITPYQTFYTQTRGSPSPNQGFRIAGKYWDVLDTAGEHLVVHYAHAMDGSRCQPLYYTAQGKWTMPPSGNATISNLVQGANTALFDSASFSTTDNGPSQSCVNLYSAVPWTYRNCCGTCPTFGQYFDPPRPAAYYLYYADIFGHTISDRCGASSPVISGSLYGEDVMEYYVR